MERRQQQQRPRLRQHPRHQQRPQQHNKQVPQWPCLRWVRQHLRLLQRCGLEQQRVHPLRRRQAWWTWPQEAPQCGGLDSPLPPLLLLLLLLLLLTLSPLLKLQLKHCGQQQHQERKQK